MQFEFNETVLYRNDKVGYISALLLPGAAREIKLYIFCLILSYRDLNKLKNTGIDYDSNQLVSAATREKEKCQDLN